MNRIKRDITAMIAACFYIVFAVFLRVTSLAGKCLRVLYRYERLSVWYVVYTALCSLRFRTTTTSGQSNMGV